MNQQEIIEELEGERLTDDEVRNMIKEWFDNHSFVVPCFRMCVRTFVRPGVRPSGIMDSREKQWEY